MRTCCSLLTDRKIDQHEATHTNSSNEDKGLEPPPPKDEDPDGSKLIQEKDGLERAAKYLAPLASLATKNIDVWIAIYDVAVRRRECHVAIKHLRSSDLEVHREIPTSRTGSSTCEIS